MSLPIHPPSRFAALCSAFLILTVVTAQAPAQQFAPDPLQGLPAVSSNPSGMVFADTDGDGDLDLLVSSQGGQNRLFESDGHGRFVDASVRLPVDSDSSQALAVGDVDGDGDPDIVVGNAWAQNRLYLNHLGAFTDATLGRLPATNDATQAVAMGDVDGDGDLDLVIGNQNAQTKLLLNNGAGVFTDVSATQMPSDTGNTHGLVLVDVDGDGDLDLLVGTDRNGNRLLVNNGAGTFTRAPSTAFPSAGDATFDLAAADVNGDGRPDILFANGLGQNRLYLNQGGGVFVDSPANLPANNNNASFAVALGDLDGDGDIDAAIGNSFGQNELWLNDGTGKFVDGTHRIPVATNATSAAAIVDVDQDGDLDLVFGNGGGPVLYSNHLRQLSSSGSLKLGATWILEVSRDRGFATGPDFALIALAVGARIQAVPLAAFGNFLIDGTAMVRLPQVALSTPGGRASLPLPVPQDPTLLNLPLSAQAVVADGQNPVDARFTNAIHERIQ